jgi:hypothetical protein
MAAQETYRIHETSHTVLRELSPHSRTHSDIALFKGYVNQSDRLLDLLYKDAERGFRYDTVEVKRYVLYLTDVEYEAAQDGKRIGEFSRLDMAEMVRDALNATL